MNTSIPLIIILYFSGAFARDCGRLGTNNDYSFVPKRELDDCLAVVGQNPIDKSIAENIWRAIKNAYGEVEDIPLHVYKNMGWILSGISLDDLRNMTIDQGELIGIFGSAESLSDDQMDVIAQKVKSDWAGKSPDKYSEYDLEILGKILCYFNQSEIHQIHPDAYRSKAEIIGKLNSCPHEIIESFARLAVQTNAFGPPSTWSKLDISEIGVVIAGLSEKEYNSIRLENLTQNKRLYNQVINSRYPDANSTKPIQYSRVNATKSTVSSNYLKRKEVV